MTDHLNIKELYFSYSQDNILQNINISIKRGSFISIVGPNGSGKSTLLKNIAKNLQPNSGEIWFETLDLLKMTPLELAKKMAVVPQTFNIDFPFSGLDTVLMGRTPFLKRFQAETDKDYALAEWAMKLTNTWHFRDRSVTQLSGGELQRVILARALVQEPEIILLDEPTAHLDIQHQMELLELLESLNKTSNLTVIAVLHDLNLASQFSDEIIMLKNGQIFAQGPTDQVLTAGNIREVYGMEVLLAENPLNQKLNIIPLARSKEAESQKKSFKIHIICGGDSGAYLMDRLLQMGYQLSTGVLNIGDTDWTKAKKAGIELVEEAPFAGISQASKEKNLAAILTADLQVITPVPFGLGNLANLEAALEGAQKGIKTIIIKNNDPLLNQDFTHGKTEEILAALKDAGAIFADDYAHFFDLLKEEADDGE